MKCRARPAPCRALARPLTRAPLGGSVEFVREVLLGRTRAQPEVAQGRVGEETGPPQDEVPTSCHRTEGALAGKTKQGREAGEGEGSATGARQEADPAGR